MADVCVSFLCSELSAVFIALFSFTFNTINVRTITYQFKNLLIKTEIHLRVLNKNIIFTIIKCRFLKMCYVSLF